MLSWPSFLSITVEFVVTKQVNSVDFNGTTAKAQMFIKKELSRLSKPSKD